MYLKKKFNHFSASKFSKFGHCNIFSISLFENNFQFLFDVRKILFLFASTIILSGCNPIWSYSDFKNNERVESKEVFKKDLKVCLKEKIKFSSIIQGREYGFRGEHAAFLGCMRYKGWSPKKSFSYN